MLAAATAVATSLACVSVARRRYRRLARSERPALSATGDDWLDGLTPNAATAGVVASVLDAPTRAHGVAEVNDLLRDLQHELDRDRGTAGATARVALLAGWLAAVIEILVSQTFVGGLSAALGATAGLGGAIVCWTLGRRADQQASELRSHWNRVAGRLERWLESRPFSQDDQSMDRAMDRR